MTEDKKYELLTAEIEALRNRLEEANDTIDAIRDGQIDALIIRSDDGPQVYTLKTADQTYRRFIEKMNEGAVTINDQFIITYCNSRFAQMVDQPLEKVIGVSIFTLVDPASLDDFRIAVENAWETESSGEIDLVNDDTSMTVLYSLSTLDMDEGKVLSVLFADLTAQKAIEHKLKDQNEALERANHSINKLNDQLEEKVTARTGELLESREHFKFLADNIPVIAWTAAPDGTVTYFNKRWYEYTGGSAAGYDFGSWLDIVHPDDREATIRSWQYAITSGEPYATEYRFLRAVDSTYRWHYGHALPYRDAQQKIVAWFGICSDIDPQKKELERKDEFISMVSHELKTPVTSIKGYTQLLRATMAPGNDGTKSYLDTMNNQINKLTRLIGDLLDATKSQSGQLHFDEEDFDFNMLVNEVVSEIQQTTDRHTLVTSLDRSIFITGDRNRIGQVITNLLSNAIKYAPESKEVLIQSTVTKNELVFSVQDFGIGIPKDQQSLLYTRFYRVTDHSTSSYTFPGMGLGLYISKTIIEKHSGKMWLESEPGKGSTFFFSLPI